MNVLRRFLTAILAASTLSFSVVKAEPVAVVSINNIDALFADTDYLMEATGAAGIGQMFMPQVRDFVQGLNSKKPIGVVVHLNGMQPIPMAFVPVDDLPGFLSKVEGQLGEAKNIGDGLLQLQGPQPVFVKETGGWAFVSPDRSALSSTPTNPETLLKGLNKKYDIAVRGFVQNVPLQLRQMASQKLSEQMEMGLLDADAAQKAVAKSQAEQMKLLLEEADELTIGLNIDSKNKNIHYDFSVTANEGSSLAKQFESAKGGKTKYSGFVVPDAAVAMNLVSNIPSAQASQMTEMLTNLENSAIKEIENDDSIEEDAVRDGAKKFVTGVFDIFRDTLKTGKADAGMSVVLGEKSITMALASHVADGSQVETLVKDLVELAEGDPEISFSKKKLNSATHGEVRLHELAIPIPADEYIGQILGGELEICLGASDTDVYVVIGSDPVTNLKKMVDNSKGSSADMDPFSVTLKLAPILKFAQAMEQDETLSAIAQMLEQNGNDNIRIRAFSIENGVSYRVLVEEGILKTLGQIGQQQMAGGF